MFSSAGGTSDDLDGWWVCWRWYLIAAAGVLVLAGVADLSPQGGIPASRVTSTLEVTPAVVGGAFPSGIVAISVPGGWVLLSVTARG